MIDFIKIFALGVLSGLLGGGLSLAGLRYLYGGHQ